MRLLRYSIIYLILLSFVSCQSNNIEIDGNGISFEENNITYKVDFFSPNIVRILSLPKGEELITEKIVVDWSEVSDVKLKAKATENGIQVISNKLIVDFDRENEAFAFYNKETSQLILQEVNNSRLFKRTYEGGEKCYSIKQVYKSSDKESLYGLGQYQSGEISLKGDTTLLLQSNMDIVNPYLVSTKGYGILWDNYSSSVFIDDIESFSFKSEVADASDYYFVYGENIDGVVSGYRELTGTVPMFPKWAFGFWQSKERYKSFAELESVVKEYRKRKIPIDNIVQDWEYWGEKDNWNSMTFKQDSFPEAEKVINRLNTEHNVRLMVSVWPGFGSKTDIYRELDEINALFDEKTWAGYKVFDVFNPQARNIFWEYMKGGLVSKGVNAWWLDATEPSFRDGFTQRKQEERTKSAGSTYLGSFHRYLNVYSLELTRFLYDKLRNESESRVFILTRSAFASQQKYATAVWSGDVTASWENMHKQVTAGINLSMSGIPYWTSDIGGFFVTERGGMYPKGLEDDLYKELYTRWFQFGAFSPLFRAHGTNVPREVWQFGEPGEIYYDTQVEYIKLRYELLPYIYSVSRKISESNYTLMRGLVMDFAEDGNVNNIDNSYMFGPAFLVRPVLKPIHEDHYTSTYLPLHNDKFWYDFKTGVSIEGGQIHKMSTPIGIIPLYVKAGSIVPLTSKDKQYTMESYDDELELRVYSGGDANFQLYDDQGEGYGFENGEYSKINLNWNDKQSKLIIDKRDGSFENMPHSISFIIKLYKPNVTDPLIKEVVYTGDRITISFNK